tara:strand:+ start:262 stop:486 length:225 start_codon:yes stop_codon:yes gene_type:complete
MGVKKMDNEKMLKDSEYYLRDISKSLNYLTKIMSNFLIIATTESKFKSKTNNEIKEVMPQINETIKSINENINV